ncbi:hypothetical protein [Algoriphagus chordae]|uniref:Phosphatidate cytidylyltransferase n=1 Tax=Algoriphagus chordae TaxID=237019 RepID=A0A2W7S5A8_9BACT|nr:hypothetical protein [Algoriphagus chordae]PZX58185.1 hypothetical protein LV85_00371 [Algoriphagus chordae]
MNKLKRFEQFSVVIAIGVVYFALLFKSIPIAILLLLFGLVIQVYIYFLYKKENRGREFLKSKIAPFIVGTFLIIFFFVKDSFF